MGGGGTDPGPNRLDSFSPFRQDLEYPKRLSRTRAHVSSQINSAILWATRESKSMDVTVSPLIK